MSVRHLSLIAACDPNGVIGNNLSLPWKSLEGDLKRFKELTNGKVLIMGRRTVESLPGPLPNRTIIQVSRKHVQSNQADTNARYKMNVESIGAAISAAITLRSNIEDEVFIAGGGQVYRWAWEHVSKIYLTVANDTYEGNVVVEEFKNIYEGKDKRWELEYLEACGNNTYRIYNRISD